MPTGAAIEPGRVTYRSDAPPSDPRDDKLGRCSFAFRVADSIAERADPASIVVGLYGPWGEGKTTVLGFVQTRLKDRSGVVVVPFNPWMYPNEDQLVASFFETVADALGRRLRRRREEIGVRLRFLGEVASTVSFTRGGAQAGGSLLTAVGRILSSVTLQEHRDRLTLLLREEGARVVVLMDDIDRLDKSEVTTVLRLVKLAADFPYTAYVLAFDPELVAACLGERYPDLPGKAGGGFLEKIVQVPLTIPRADPSLIAKLVLDDLSQLLSGHDIELTHEQTYRLLRGLDSGVLAQIRTLRAGKRFLNALEFALPVMPTEVEVVDLIFVEALRAFYPRMYAVVRDHKREVTMSPRRTGGVDQVRAALAPGYEVLSPTERQSCELLLQELYPHLDALSGNRWHAEFEEEEWARQRRITAPRYFDRYFAYGLPVGDVPNVEMDRLIGMLSSGGDSGQLLTELFEGGREALVLEKLRERSRDLDAVGASALARLIGRLAGRFAGAGASMVFVAPAEQASMLVVNLLIRIPAEHRRTTAVSVLADADPRFAALMLRWLMAAAKDDSPGGPPFAEQELGPLGREFADRLLTLNATTALPRRFPGMADLMFVICREFGAGEQLFEQLLAGAATRWEDAVALLQLYPLPSAEAALPGPVARGIGRDAYDRMASVIPPDRLMAALRRHVADLDQQAADFLARLAPDNPKAADDGVRLAVMFAAMHLTAEAEPLAPLPTVFEPSVSRPSAVQELHPHSAYSTSSDDPDDLVVRVAVHLPQSVTQLLLTTDGLPATRLEGGPREQVLCNLLDASSVTGWVRRAQDAWQLKSVGTWQPDGLNEGEYTSLVLSPPGSSAPRSPIRLRCHVRTGWGPLNDESPQEREAGLQVAVDVRLAVLELDAERNPSQTRHATTPPPAPAALQLNELADLLVDLLGVVDVAQDAAAQLRPGGRCEDGQLGCWLVASSGLDRVVNLGELPAIPGSGQAAESGLYASLPLTPPTSNPFGVASLAELSARRRLAVTMIEKMLLRAQRRQYEATLHVLQRSLASGPPERPSESRE